MRGDFRDASAPTFQNLLLPEILPLVLHPFVLRLASCPTPSQGQGHSWSCGSPFQLTNDSFHKCALQPVMNMSKTFLVIFFRRNHKFSMFARNIMLSGLQSERCIPLWKCWRLSKYDIDCVWLWKRGSCCLVPPDLAANGKGPKRPLSDEVFNESTAEWGKWLSFLPNREEISELC